MKPYARNALLLGLLIWLLATVLFRLSGHVFFLHENPFVMGGLYLGVVPLLVAVAWGFMRFHRLTDAAAVVAAAYMVLPGMLLDTFFILWFAHLMPNLPATADAAFGSWLMWAYASVLAGGMLYRFFPDG